MVKKRFSYVEVLVFVAVVALLFSLVVAVFSDARRDAHDKTRLRDLAELAQALAMYHEKTGGYPRESDGANGNIAVNPVFQTLVGPYLRGIPRDPLNTETFFYYYDGAHRCGDRTYAVVFARQMENHLNANFLELRDGTCVGVLDGEGRGGGEFSYTLLVGTTEE